MSLVRNRSLAVAAAAAMACTWLLPTAHAAPPEPSTAELAIPDEALAPSGTILAERSDATVAPGIHYTSFSRYAPNGWLRGDIMTLDLTEEAVTLDYVDTGKVAATATLTDQLEGAGAIAGVNGEGFDINDTGAAHGVGVKQAGEIVKGYGEGTTHRRGPSAVIGSDGLAEVAQLFLDASATDGEHDLTVDYLNTPNVSGNAIALFTPEWGDVAVLRTVNNPSGTWQVLLRDGVVVSSAATIDAAGLADNEQVLVGIGTKAAELAEFTVGETITLDYEMRGSDDIAAAINGFFPVVIDGEIVTRNTTDLHPRTVLAVGDEGERMALMTVDGRQTASRGMTEVETAQFFLDLGYDDVLNLDGGGSSQMNARIAGDDEMTIRSNPSDGGERHTANSLGVFVAEGSDRVVGYKVAAANSDAPADGDTGDDFVVMQGLSRELTAQGFNEVYAPVPSKPRWADAHGNVRIDAATSGAETATVTGAEPGVTDLVVSRGHVTHEQPLVVIGEPVRLSSSTQQVSLPTQEQTGTFQILGHDARGFSTWIEPADVELEYDSAQVEITAEGDRFRVKPLVESGAVVVTARVAGEETQLAVTIGLAREVVDELDTGEGWTAVRYPSAMPVPTFETAPGAGPDGRDALALNYSMTGTTATRAAYLQYPARIDLTGTPQRMGLWVHGDGSGVWLRGNLYQAGATSPSTINFAYVTWKGWRYVEADIPAGLNMPLQFFRFYAVETNPAKQYSGRLMFQDLTLRAAPEVPALEVEAERNPAIVTGAALPEDSWQFAVVADAQFTADNPDSAVVQAARRSLREIVEREPEFIVVNGDWVDRGFPQDIALAKRVLEEEIPDDIPYFYVVGNHEIAGPGNLNAWIDEFGDPWYTYDHNGTRIIVRATPGYNYRSGGFDQLLDLKDQLDDAATNDEINNVIVFQHHPLTENSATGGSTITDPHEAALVEEWFAEFHRSTGKGIALHAAGTGTFEAAMFDGVHQFTNGNAGKGPNGSPDAGGFTGWSMVAVDPTPDEQWVNVAFVPHTDALEVSAPEALQTGEAGAIEATVVQDGRRVPVAYPVSATFETSDGAAYDHASGEFTAYRAGTHTLSVTVNDVTETVTIEVTGDDVAQPSAEPAEPAEATVAPAEPKGKPQLRPVGPNANRGNKGGEVGVIDNDLFAIDGLPGA